MKKIWLLIVAIMMALSLSACRIGDGDGSNNGGSSGGDSAGSGSNSGTGDSGTSGGDSTGDTADGFEFVKGRQYYIVLGEGVSMPSSLTGFINYVQVQTGLRPINTTEAEGSHEYEIIIGKTESAASRKAYRALNKSYKGLDGEMAWAIYEDNGSVGIAFDSEYSMERAIDYFASNYTSLRCGRNALESFLLIDYLDEVRNSQRESYLDRISTKYGEEVRDSFSKILDMYTFEHITWRANLWDPQNGGFYYSNSGRDNYGYLPDIESTVQMLSFMSMSGFIDGIDGYLNEQGKTDGKLYRILKAEYPEFAEKLLAFARSLQDPEDGYFYHPQWGKAITVSRRGRDLNWSTQLIKGFGELPYYNAPDGTKGMENAGGSTGSDAEAVSARLSFRLGTSSVSAVSKVVSAASSTLPEFLRSITKYEAYLDSFDWEHSSYGAGNELAAQVGQISNAGKQFKDFTISYLSKKQKSNGLWEEQIDYNSTNGLMKISYVYASFGVDFPRAKEAMAALMQMALDTNGKVGGNDHTCDKYNLWYTMEGLLDVVSAADAAVLKKQIEEQLPEMLEATYYMTHKFLKDDGSFSYYRNSTAGGSQGAAVAVPGTNEGDVNASSLAGTGLLNGIAGTLGLSRVPLYTTADFRYFMDIIYALEPIDKLGSAEIVYDGFDDYEFNPVDLSNGIMLTPSDKINIRVNDKEIVGQNYKWVSASITDSPSPLAEGDKALHFKVNTYACSCGLSPCTCKKVATSASALQFNVQNNPNIQVTNSYVAEFRLYVANTGARGNVVAQLAFNESQYGGQSNSFNLSISSDGKTLTLYDNLAGLDNMSNSRIASGLATDQWHSYRFELYKTKQFITDPKTGKTSSYNCNVTKIFIDGEYVGESDSALVDANTGLTQNKGVAIFSVSGYRTVPGDMYFDDLSAYTSDVEYECFEAPGEGVLDNFAVDKSSLVTTFENGKTASYYVKNLVGASGTVRYEVVEKDGDNALHIVSDGTAPSGATNKTATTFYTKDEGGECYAFEANMLYDTAAMAKQGTQYLSQFAFLNGSINYLGFSVYYSSGRLMLQHNGNYIGGSNSQSSPYVKDIDGNDFSLPKDKWFTFRIEFYYTAEVNTTFYKIYIDEGEGLTCRAEQQAYKAIPSGGQKIKNFTLSHYRTGTVDMYIDDVSAEISNKKFVTSVPDPNTENFEFGYESGERNVSHTAQEGDSISLSSDPTDKIAHALKIEDATSSGSSSISVNYFGSQITNGVTTFKTGIYLDKIMLGELMRIGFVGTGGEVMSLSLYGMNTYAYFVAPTDGYTVAENTLMGNSANKISLDKWVEVTVVYDNASVKENSTLTVYVNGAEAGVLKCYKGTSDTPVLSNVWSVTLTTAEAAKSTLYLDNISLLEQYVIPESVDSPSADELTTVTPGETFDNLGGKLIGDGTDSKVKFGKGTCATTDLTLTQSDDTIIVTSDPMKAENEVLMFRDGSVSSNSTLQLSYSGNQVVNGITVFETKLYIPKSGLGGSSVVAQLSFNKGRTAQFNLNLNAYSDKSQVYFVLNDTEGAETGRAITTDAWHTLRLEYYNYADTTNSCVKVYIDNLYAGSIAAGTATDCNSFFWKGYSGGLSTIYFDNMSLTEKKAD